MKKVVLVTGCAKGIGREIVLSFVKAGYDIIGTYNTSTVESIKLKEELELLGVNINLYKLDISNEEEINTFCEIIKTKYSKIDILINNAAISIDNSFEEKTKKEFMKVLEVNLVGPFLLIQKLYMLMNNGSKIINISSTDGINTYSKLNIDYSASKAGLINLTKSLALQFDSIKVYALCPNWVDTESIREMNQEYLNQELNRVGQKKLIAPKDVANKIINMIENDIESGSIIVMEE